MFIADRFSRPGTAVGPECVSFFFRVGTVTFGSERPLTETVGLLVRLDTVWVKFESQGRRAKFKITGGETRAGLLLG